MAAPASRTPVQRAWKIINRIKGKHGRNGVRMRLGEYLDLLKIFWWQKIKVYVNIEKGNILHLVPKIYPPNGSFDQVNQSHFNINFVYSRLPVRLKIPTKTGQKTAP